VEAEAEVEEVHSLLQNKKQKQKQKTLRVDWVFFICQAIQHPPSKKLKRKIIAKKALHNNQQTNLHDSFSLIRNDELERCSYEGRR
jgi:hypothetical protein